MASGMFKATPENGFGDQSPGLKAMRQYACPHHSTCTDRISKRLQSLRKPQTRHHIQYPPYCQSLLHRCRGRQNVWCSSSQAVVPGPQNSSSSSSSISKITAFLSEQFLPLALLSGMTLGCLAPTGGVQAAKAGLQTVTTTGIFIVSGLGMRRGETLQAFSAWGSVLFGMLSILIITPLAALIALRLPLQPPELAFGLAVFCCMPTTLSSGVSLTQAVGGNTALALLLTVGSNLLGIFTMPFVLSALLGSVSGSIKIAPKPLLQSLIKTILIPLLIGASTRAFVPGVAKLVDNRKKQLAMLSATLLAMVPWMQISKAVADQVSVQPAALATAVAAGVAIHFVFLAFNMTAVRALKLGGGDNPSGMQRAVVLVGSQKTLPIAVTVLNQLSAKLSGPIGLAVVPCVVAHLSQILIDSVLVSRWLRADAVSKPQKS